MTIDTKIVHGSQPIRIQESVDDVIAITKSE